jgi:hypothetical protein
LEGGEERGEDEGESPPSGREDDMLAEVAVAMGVSATWSALVAYRLAVRAGEIVIGRSEDG